MSDVSGAEIDISCIDRVPIRSDGWMVGKRQLGQALDDNFSLAHLCGIFLSSGRHGGVMFNIEFE